jgi:hypothetical protein
MSPTPKKNPRQQKWTNTDQIGKDLPMRLIEYTMALD